MCGDTVRGGEMEMIIFREKWFNISIVIKWIFKLPIMTYDQIITYNLKQLTL